MAIQIGQQGWSQQTPAARAIISGGLGSVRRSVSRRRSKSSKARTGKRASKRASSSKKRSSTLKRFVKGSAAAKAYMKKLRAKRK